MEACVEYVGSAKNAEAGGAVRLELCSALSEGGLTPSVGLLRKIKKDVNLPVCVMIRPRTGNDFIYSEDEISIMEEDIDILRANGADGFVFGALTKEFKVDKDVCCRLMKKVGGLPVTFHRAFDVCEEPFAALEDIIEVGFSRLLTSGQSESAASGSSVIKKLVERAGHRLTVMPGCGVNAGNLHLILAETGAQEFHATAREKVSLPCQKTSVEMGHGNDESVIYVTSVEKVKQLVSIYSKFTHQSKK